MFDSVDDVVGQLGRQGYICGKNIGTVVYLADAAREARAGGRAGRASARPSSPRWSRKATGRPLIRLQCYEGLDEAKALYEWEYSKQLLYTQILKEKFAEAMAGATTLTRCRRARRARGQRVLLRALHRAAAAAARDPGAERRPLLLIDEVDKSDPEFEAFLLEVLSDFQVTVPEVGTLEAKHKPLVFLTSNDAREMSDALKRRCLHLYIDFPDEDARDADPRDEGAGHRRAARRGPGRHDAAPAQARPEEDALDLARRSTGRARCWR